MASKSKRVKPAKTAVLKIESWQKADELIKQIADLQLKIKESEASVKGRIDEIKGSLARDVAARQEAIKLYHRSLEAFSLEHLKDFEPKQSKQLNFGKLGWRKSTLIIITKKTLELLREVFGSKAKEFIRTKEEPDKETMAKLKDEELASVGARRKIQEVFFVEPDLPEAVNYGTKSS